MLDKWINFITFHERIILVLAGLGVLAVVGSHWINRSYDSANAKNAAAQQVLQEQVAKNADLQKQQDARVQQYQAMLDTLTKQNQSLVSGILARNQAVQTQQTTDETLPLADLAVRQQTLAGTTGISAENGSLVESPVAAVAVTQKLESLPALEQNVKDQQTVISNKDSQIASITAVVNGANDQINGLKVQITDEQKACQTQVAEVKAAARKSKRGWFLKGLAVGAAIGAYLALHI